MKNRILLICLLSSHVVFGQFVAGTKMLQGDFNLQSSFAGNYHPDNEFNRRYIQASIGSQIANITSETRQWGFGTRLSIINDASKFTAINNVGVTIGNNHSRLWALTFDVFQIRLKKLLPNFYGGFRYSSGLGYSAATSKNTSTQSILTQPGIITTSDPTSQNSIMLNVGITSQFYYFITPKWGLSANIGNVNAYFTHNFKNKSWAFDTNSGFGGVGFGLFKILQK